MKKIFLVFCVLIFGYNIAFAQYKPIPKNLSKQYQQEMEQIINEEYPKAIKNANNYTKEAKDLYDKILKSGFNYDDAMNIVLIAEVCIPAAELDLYAKLLKVTQEKYLGEKYIPIGTDNTMTFENILNPYFESYRINTKKLLKIENYETKQINRLKKYILRINKLQPKHEVLYMNY